jgi:hypothetical protein
MHFDPYIVFSIVSGVTLLVLAAFAPKKAAERVITVVVGLAFIGYALYVGHKTSGTYDFPVAIFVIPFIAAFRLISLMVHRTKQVASSRPGN